MVYHYQTGVYVPFARKHYKQLSLAIAAVFIATIGAITFNANAASPVVVNGCSFDQTPTSWTLQADCTSSAEINIPSGVTLDGGGFTISSSFPKTDNSNNASIGIVSSDNVTVKNLKIDGTGGLAYPQGLHGINVYESTGVTVNNVTVKNMSYSGISVNSSTVNVSNVTTSGNGWHGINVDQKTTSPSVLNIVGHMNQTDTLQIYVDNAQLEVTVNDTLHQYAVSHLGLQPNDLLYTLKYVTSKDDCKNNGWMLGLNATTSFKNQGQCVANFASNGKNIR